MQTFLTSVRIPKHCLGQASLKLSSRDPFILIFKQAESQVCAMIPSVIL